MTVFNPAVPSPARERPGAARDGRTPDRPTRVAVIGTGIAGLVSAHLLASRHDVTVFEAGDRIGGHTVTTEVLDPEGPLAVDAGFIVYNEPNYPNFVRLIADLGVETRATSMSFSVTSERPGIEYAGTSLNALFAQRGNLLRPRYYRFLGDILRFNRAARLALAEGSAGTLGTLAEFLAVNRLSGRLAEQYVIPLTAAIWSTDPRQILDTPAEFVLRFLDNHRLLHIGGRPTWRVIRGGSQRYVDRLIRPFRDRIRTRTPVRQLRRSPGGVEVTTGESREVFDEVVVATHSDQALAMLAQPTELEWAVLDAIRYQPNHAILHTDVSVLPRQRRAWASWNYRTPRDPGRPVAVTYNMTRLQRLPTQTTYCVSLNLEDAIDESRVIARFDFEHPLFTRAAVAAQARHAEVSGADRIHYCGAYWGNGFHEDGVVSALAVARRLGVAA
ncbi:MAG: NAD(P)-binding protein [Acidobacteria bacterium]|nr:NAD(P)-binding protein [Acidobacteriota bacterium]MYJ04758.1 NAD(P)-binding protein [Acidobacteriota bacterium]